MPHNENSRVKIPALVHFTRLGYKYISLRKYEGVIDDDTNILVDVFCDAINRINATSLTTTDVQKIVNALKAMLENDDLGREFYSVLINGYNGLKLIDFEDFGGTVNSYHVVTEMNCKNGSDEFRPDITPLINGIPLAFIEVKKPNNKGGVKAEYDRMLMRVKNKKFRRFINLTQIMVFSNNSEYDDTEAIPLEGAFYSTISYEKLFFSHFREEDEKLLTSVPEKDEAVENFILTDNNLSSIKYSPEYVTNSSPVSPTNRIITSLFSFERILTFLKYAIAYDELVSLFEEANLAFLQAEHSLFRTEVAERTLCGALMLHIHDIIKEDDSYSGYYADVEYNRNAGGIKTIRKTIRGQQEEIIPINCDLILHSRGENVDQDNLIAIEMKKSNAPSAEKQKDRERLIALTKDSFDDVWAWDHNLPEHVCRYVLGVYYEINYRQKEIYIEYYRRGELVRSYSNHFVG